MFDPYGISALSNMLGSQVISNPLNQQMNQMINQKYNQMLQNQYNQAVQPKPYWVFNGRTCTVREMADCIWPTDCPEKTHFLLKYE